MVCVYTGYTEVDYELLIVLIMSPTVPPGESKLPLLANHNKELVLKAELL